MHCKHVSSDACCCSLNTYCQLFKMPMNFLTDQDFTGETVSAVEMFCHAVMNIEMFTGRGCVHF